MKKITKANKLFTEGYNCCQSVFTPFALEHGLNKADSLKISSTFAAGMCFQGDTCGTVVGAHLVIGLLVGYQNPNDVELKEKTRALIDKFREEFISKNGSCSCKELLGANPALSQDLNHLREKGIFKQKCPGFVGDSVEILENLLGKTDIAE